MISLFHDNKLHFYYFDLILIFIHFLNNLYRVGIYQLFYEIKSILYSRHTLNTLKINYFFEILVMRIVILNEGETIGKLLRILRISLINNFEG